MAEWIAKAAALIGSLPWITVPDSFTRMRSETRIREKWRERGFSPVISAIEVVEGSWIMETVLTEMIR